MSNTQAVHDDVWSNKIIGALKACKFIGAARGHVFTRNLDLRILM